jgi:hypothetical protein
VWYPVIDDHMTIEQSVKFNQLPVVDQHFMFGIVTNQIPCAPMLGADWQQEKNGRK